MDNKNYGQRLEVSGNELVSRVKELAQDANTRRVVVRSQDGKELVAAPMGWGAAGSVATLVLAPWMVALAAIGGVMAKVKLEIERTDVPAAGQNDGEQAPVIPQPLHDVQDTVPGEDRGSGYGS